ncbi:hypothetical protein C9F11_21200 [Streptomyces sp. YIM 121038]|uniref:hypothetical protein n=1 Tax=Streptomyces sp. YIM 121038 TaxID=2136401 RepID=UPI00111036EE|nr:hypothetical protein [Streptomyces sp. YIM 121038]QCX77872.1 hypothetical protein C9F11_21200 [Streptomyces sp. YIM 121038]
MAYHIVFEDLPPSTRRPSDSDFRHADTAKKLKAQPHAWCRVQKRKKRGDAATAAYQIRNGILAAFRPAGAFEAKSKTVNDEFFVYARYVGGASASDGSQ